MAAKGKMQELVEERGQSIERIVADELDEHGTLKAVAAALGVSQSSVTYWLLGAGVELRSVLVYSNTGYGLTQKAKALLAHQTAAGSGSIESAAEVQNA